MISGLNKNIEKPATHLVIFEVLTGAVLAEGCCRMRSLK
jgi:hypothetical protein